MRFRSVVLLLLVAGAVLFAAGSAAQTGGIAPSKKSTVGHRAGTIVYQNAQYGFCFNLPASWKGYSVIQDQWNGSPLDGGAQTSGPELKIRHPKWTGANPYEDIPIMVFTPLDWKRVVKEAIAVSAAPIGPSELGHNSQYVFALPARYNFDAAIGYEEVDELIRHASLKAPCSPGGKHQ